MIAEVNRGFRTASISREELTDLARVRTQIECQCLESAIEHGDLQWETEIVASLFELSRVSIFESEDSDRLNANWTKCHKRFHEALTAACDSRWLLWIRATLFTQSERYRHGSIQAVRSTRDIHKEHQDIADATLARDVPAATAALRKHLQLTAEILSDAQTYPTAARVS